ncbi:hypothetical protein M9X92_011885 [Pyricularia oryzae]|nr:hypothetical protein M9X92_011885 [Pyricularia oryzae]
MRNISSKRIPWLQFLFYAQKKPRPGNRALESDRRIRYMLGNWNERLISGGPKFEDGKGNKLGSRRGGPTAFAAEF